MMGRVVSVKVASIILIAFILCAFIVLYLPLIFNPFWLKLKTEINSGRKVVAIENLVTLEWDIVCIVPPYSVLDNDEAHRIKEYIPYDLSEFESKIPSVSDDGAWAFVFIRQGKVVGVEKRGIGYYVEALYENNCISKENAKIIVTGRDSLIITDKLKEREND